MINNSNLTLMGSSAGNILERFHAYIYSFILYMLIIEVRSFNLDFMLIFVYIIHVD